MWVLAVVCGLVVGKTIIHGILLSHFLRLKMFRADQVRRSFKLFRLLLQLFRFPGFLDGSVLHRHFILVPLLSRLQHLRRGLTPAVLKVKVHHHLRNVPVKLHVSVKNEKISHTFNLIVQCCLE